ncbi:ABC transporter permease subunit [Nitriliruptor alkaliphilus]|uniref:ABC transporter permease subunit n=1 Tax=Nitriliruptor alkaliphilus TaxID=427918 RepID=UPI000695F704
MLTPALVLLVLFLVVPFVSAFALSFTNQRLISPNPTEYVGTAQFTRLLTVRPVTLSPETDPATGGSLRDDAGALVYPSLRELTRDNPDRPELAGLQEWTSFSLGERRIVFLAGDAVFMRSLVNTLIFAVVIVPLQGGLGLLLALLVNKRTRGVNVFRAIYFVPVVMSMVVVSILWSFLYDPSNGLINNSLGFLTRGALGPIDFLGDTRTALPSVMLMSVWQAVGFHMVIWLSGLQSIPGTLYEAASIDGATRWQEFRFVTWPGLRNTMVFVMITITIAAFGLFTQIDVMTRGGPLDSTSTVVFHAVQQGYRQQNIAYGSAISVVFFLMVLVVALVQRVLTRDKD